MVAGVTTALTAARVDLVNAVRGELTGILPAYRVHEYQPAVPVSPMVWAGPMSMAPDSIDGKIPVVTLTGSLFAPADGAAGQAVAMCDVLAPALWQAVDSIATPTAANVGYIDVGGPLLFGVTLTFQMVVAIASICPMELVTLEVTP